METIKQKIKALIPKAFMYRYYLHSAKKAVLPDLKRRVYDKVYDASEVERLNRDPNFAISYCRKRFNNARATTRFWETCCIETM